MVAALTGVCTGRGAHPKARRVHLPPSRASSGLYWGRWAEVPTGMRVAVWIDTDGERLRGSWSLPPWHGELAGLRRAEGYVVEWREEGTVAVLSARSRRVVLGLDREGSLRGGDVALVRASFRPPELSPGLWFGRWTGLPPGVAVETLLSQSSDGHWRAAYVYQQREGSFDGELRGDGSLAIRWTELSAGNSIARGEGLLRPTILGMRGTYGVGELSEATGYWSLEPGVEP